MRRRMGKKDCQKKDVFLGSSRDVVVLRLVPGTCYRLHTRLACSEKRDKMEKETASRQELGLVVSKHSRRGLV